MKNIQFKIFPLVALAVLGLLAGPARAQIIASDDFSYPDGNLNGDNGGTGWTGAWIGNTYGTPTVAGGQAVISSSGTDARRILPSFQGPGTVVWLRYDGQQFTSASAGVTNKTFGGLNIVNGGSSVGLIGKAWPGPYRWTLVAGSDVKVSKQSTLSASSLYARITTTNTMTMDLWVNPANPTIIDKLTPDVTDTFPGNGWDAIYLRAGSGESVTESWKFDNLVIAGSLAGLWLPTPLGPPRLLAYEGFTNYPAGILPGQPFGGTGFESGAWTGTGRDAGTVTTNGGLTSIFSVAQGGGKATVKGDGSDVWALLNLGTNSAFRTAGLYDAASGTIGGGNVSGVLYLSFLFRAVSTDRNNEYGGLQLASGSNYTTGILIGNTEKEWAYTFYNPATKAIVTLRNAGGSGNYLNMDNFTHLFVAKIIYNAGTRDHVTVWMDPDPTLGETNQPSATYIGIASGDFSFDRFALRGGWNATGEPHPFDFDEIRFGTTWTAVLPPGPPPPQLTNRQLNVRFNNNGTIQSLALLRSNAWDAVSFRADSYAGPAWKILDGSGTRNDPLTLAYPTCGILTSTNATYTNVVFTGFDDINTNLQLALEYQLSSNQLAIVASITNAGKVAWSPTRAGILMGLNTALATYPAWDYLYNSTLLRCEQTHFWGYAMTPLGRILGFASPDPVASWHNEYGGGWAYTFGLDFLNQLPLPARHPQNLTTLQPGQGMSWTVFLGDIANNDPVSMEAVLPALAASAKAPMIEASRYTGAPGDLVNFTFWGNPVGGSLQTPDGVVHPLTLVASSNGMATASFTLPAAYGLCNLLVTNVAGRIAQGSVNVRRPWSWYLQEARINAINKPQKDTGAQCEGYYGFYSMFLAKRWFPDAALDSQSEAKFNELYPLMFSPATGLPTYNAWRIQNSAAMAGILADRYKADGNITNMIRAAELCDFIVRSQGSNGGYYNGGGSDYTSVIYPGKSIMEVMALEQRLGLTNSYWQKEYASHYNSVGRAMDHLALNLDNIGTEGGEFYEDGMISCSGAQLGMYALLQTNVLARQKYLNTAAWFESAHRCLDQIVVPDASHNGGTERYWEDQFDIIAGPEFTCSPHGWSAWNIYGRWYLYQLTGNVKYLRQAMNALGAGTQLIDPASGNLRWAFCTDPFIQATIFTNNPANTNPKTQGVHVAQIVGEQYVPMISGWCLAPQGTQVSEYSGNDGGCNDNDVHEIFKCLEEVALTSAYVVVNADASVETWNCQAIRTNSTLLVIPSENIVDRISLNAAVPTTVSFDFNGQLVTTNLPVGIGWQINPFSNNTTSIDKAVTGSANESSTSH